MWRRFDNFMQNWYMSMSDPWRHLVMGGIGIAAGAVIIIAIALVGGAYV
jgi:hypothetical protein